MLGFLLRSTLPLPGTAFLVAGVVFGQTTRLSGPLVPTPGTGDVVEFEVSSDGLRTVYLADAEVDGQVEIYSASLVGGGSPVKLNGSLAPGGEVHGFWLSPDGSRVVYLADEDGPGQFALHTIPIAGGVRTQLTNTALGVIDHVAISPDGSRVACNALSKLWTMSIDGSQPPLDITATSLDLEYRFSDDGAWVVLRRLGSLYSVPVGGGGELQLNAPLPSGGAVQTFRIGGQSQRVVYLADQEADGRMELFSVPIDGALAPVPISIDADLQDELEVQPDFEISGVRVYHRARVNASTSLFVASLDGSTSPFKLNPPAGSPTILDYVIDPSGSFAVYRSRYGPSGAIDLYAVPTDGGQAAENLTGLVASDVEPGYRVAPLGGRIALRAGDDVYAATLDAGEFTPLSSTPEAKPSLSDLALSSDGVHVVWHAGSSRDLYSAPIDGSLAPLKISGALAPGGHVERGFALLPNGPGVVYRADQDQQGQVEVFGAPLTAPTFSVQLSAELEASGYGDVKDARLSTSGGWSVYRSDAGQQDFDRLFSVRTDGSGPPIELASLAAGSTVLDFAIAPDDSLVAFRVLTSECEIELHAVPIDGSPTPVSSLAASSVAEYRIAPDSASIVFVVDDALHVASLDGSGRSSALDGPPIASSSSEPPFAFAPDGSRVLYRSSEAGSVVLYSASIDGATGPTNLSGPLVAGGGVREFQIDPVSGRVVYVADRTVVEDYGLFSAPIDASSAAVELDLPIVGGNDAQSDFRFGADGLVLFRNGLDLFSVPIDASGAPVLLVDGVLSFRLSPDGSRLVYLRDDELSSQTLPGVASFASTVPGEAVPALLATGVEDDYSISPDGARVVFRSASTGALSSIAIDGNGGAVELSALQPAWHVAEVELSADGRRVVYRVDHGSGDVDLYATPIAHTQQDLPLTSAAPSTADVAPDFALTPDGSRVLFVHDPQVDGAFELFVARLGPRAFEVSPGQGLIGSGLPVLVRGSGFVPGMTVKIGRRPAQLVEFVDSSEVKVVPVPPAFPPLGSFKVDVEVSDGVVTSFLPNAFVFFSSPIDPLGIIVP